MNSYWPSVYNALPVQAWVLDRQADNRLIALVGTDTQPPAARSVADVWIRTFYGPFCSSPVRIDVDPSVSLEGRGIRLWVFRLRSNGSWLADLYLER